MIIEKEDIKLIITIRNTEPIELIDIVSMFDGLDREYKKFIKRHDPHRYRKRDRLYLNQVRSGSQEFELISIVPVVLGGIEGINSLFEFTDHLKQLFKSLVADNKEEFSDKDRVKDIDTSTEKNLSKILSPIVKDNGSQMNLSATYQENHIHYHLNSQEAETIQRNLYNRQHKIEKAGEEAFINISDKARPTVGIEMPNFNNEKVVFYWAIGKDTNYLNSGVIESIYHKALRVEFIDSGIEKQIRNVVGDPFESAFLVDVEVETFQGRPILYKIVRLHDIIPTKS